MKHQVYRCLLAKLKGKQRVFKPYFCIRFDVSNVPYAPVKLLGIPRKSHMDMPCRIRGFNRILERCSYGPPRFQWICLAKFLGCLTGALPETNFCLQMRCNYMQLLADLFVFSLFVFDTGANPLQSWKLYIVSTRDEHFLASFWSPKFPYFQGQTCGVSFRQTNE